MGRDNFLPNCFELWRIKSSEEDILFKFMLFRRREEKNEE